MAHRHEGQAGADPFDAATRSRLRAAVASALAPAIDGAGAWSCVVLAPGGAQLYANRAASAVMPASTQKLIVASASLALLGPAYRFHTLFAAQAPRNGEIDGPLYLAGSGDPSLRSNDLRGGVKRLWDQGVRTITAGVVVDASAIAGEEINPFWNADDANEDFEAATSGISLDEDTVEFHVRAGAPGTPARVWIEPPSPAIHYSGSVATGDADDVVVGGTDLPNTFILSGSIPPQTTELYYLPVHGIPRYAGVVLAAMLRARGITVARDARTGTTPLASSVLWDHPSKPLSVLLRDMLFKSDNHYAEQLMRTLGGIGGAPDDAGGLRVERRFLRRNGIPMPGIHLVDGSGLAHVNRVAAITLARILELEARKRGDSFYELLPRGGKDGTLRDDDFTDALGRVRAKSGHLSGVSALAGYVQSRHHGRLIFAFLIHGSPGDPDSAIVSAVDRLSEF